MPGPNDLQDLASEYLAAAEQAVATTIGGPISRSYISPGLPSFDCGADEISVYVGPAAEGPTSPLSPPLVVGLRSVHTEKVNLVALTCTVVRCVPTVGGTGQMPSASAIEAAAAKTNADLWAIWNVVPAFYRAGQIFTRSDGEQRLLIFDPAVPLDPSGGVGGWRVQIRVELDGYRPVVVP